MALEVFEKIRDEDVCLYNMNITYCHPTDLILTHIIVPPSCIRPTIKETDGSLRHDDLTSKIHDFMIRNDKIKALIESEGDNCENIFNEWNLF